MFKIHTRIICKDGTTFHLETGERYHSDEIAQKHAHNDLIRFRDTIANSDAFSFKDMHGVRWALFKEDLESLRVSVTVIECKEPPKPQ